MWYTLDMKQTLIRECIGIAKRKNPNRGGIYRHYSFLIQRNKLIEWADNIRCGDYTKWGYSKYAGGHSEFLAYRKAKGILLNESFEMLNIRLNKRGVIKNSKPCSCCYDFLKELGCKLIVYSIDEKYFGRIVL